MNSRKEKNLFSKLLASEQKFFSTEFLAPAINNNPITVKIEGVLVNLRVAPSSFNGWGIFKTADKKTAELVREANIREISQYTKMFPKISFMITDVDNQVFGYQVSENKYKINGCVPIFLCNNVSRFDVVDCCFTGSHILFSSGNRRYNRRIISSMVDSLAKNVHPDKLNIAGLSQSARECYNICFQKQIKLYELTDEDRIKEQAHRGGIIYKKHRKIGKEFIITYEVDGQSYTSRFNENLQCNTAGICLNGTDNLFDFQGLGQVIRLGQDTGRIYRFD